MRWSSISWTGAAPPSNRFDLQDIADGSIIQNIVEYPRYCRLPKIWPIVQDIVDYPKYCRLSKIMLIIQDNISGWQCHL